MSEIITYVGIDAHKRELHVAMLIGTAATPVAWTVRTSRRPSPASTASSSARRRAGTGL